MKFTIENPNITVAELCQRINYEPQLEKGCGNYVKPLGKDNYPRFHLLVEEDEDEFRLKLHLDQRGEDDHHSEYESERVAEEVKRIKGVIFSEVL